jgi:hypothetical protein
VQLLVRKVVVVVWVVSYLQVLSLPQTLLAAVLLCRMVALWTTLVHPLCCTTHVKG